MIYRQVSGLVVCGRIGFGFMFSRLFAVCGFCWVLLFCVGLV